MNQQVIITLRGSAELKMMLVNLSKLKHEPMNVVVADLIRKECESRALFQKVQDQGGLAGPVAEIGEAIEMPIPVKRQNW